MFDFHRSDRGSNPDCDGEKFHNVYDYTIERHPWQMSENHKPWVHPSHVREIGQSDSYADETQDWAIVANKLALS